VFLPFDNPSIHSMAIKLSAKDKNFPQGINLFQHPQLSFHPTPLFEKKNGIWLFLSKPMAI